MLAGRGRQFSRIKALITNQEGVQWRMDIQSGSENFMPLKLVLVGVGISELSVGGEDFTIIQFDIFLT